MQRVELQEHSERGVHVSKMRFWPVACFSFLSYGYNRRKMVVWPLLLLPMSRLVFANSRQS
jgi:hypothetical protein